MVPVREGRVEVALVCERLDCIARAKKALRLEVYSEPQEGFGAIFQYLKNRRCGEFYLLWHGF
jgi:hypothetical protein